MTKPRAVDAIALAANLIRCPSVTPAEAGALDLLEVLLSRHGFLCTRIRRGGVDNLFARFGTEAPVFGFNGHTDVVPVGDAASWTRDPFGGEIVDGVLWGRGATDMKSGVAAFVAAAVEVAAEAPSGSISLLITGDEEGVATDGTTAILDWMAEVGQTLDFCIVGEPTSVDTFGDVMKIGRRGSATGFLTVSGVQGHSAYPERANNPLPVLARVCSALAGIVFDEGSEHFQQTTLALTSIDVGNPANNVIPASGRAVFNIRFNDLHSGESLRMAVSDVIERAVAGSGCTATLDWKITGESFLTRPGPVVEMVSDVIARRVQGRPKPTTGGGTSDARFVKSVCPVIEFGLVGRGMHQVDERVPVEDIDRLTDVYVEILREYFARQGGAG